MLILSGLLTSASGSIGDINASHGRAGLYLRQNPPHGATPSQRQIDCRQFMTDAAVAWRLLSSSLRASWYRIAEQSTKTNRLGQSYVPTASTMFTAAYCFRAAALLTPVATAPTHTGPCLLSKCTPRFAGLTPPNPLVLSMAFNVNDPWVNDDLGILEIGISPPTWLTRVFYKGPYTLIGTIVGSSTAPPTSPTQIATVTYPGTGKGYRTSVRAIDSNNIPSLKFYLR